MKKAIVLGGTAPHIELIRQLKERNYETILVDYYSDSAAKSYADRHIQESTLDMDKVLEIALKEKADLVITTNVDQANVTACYVAEKLGLPHPYSLDAALNCTRKGQMKEIFKKSGIPTSDYYVLGKNDNAEIRLPFPIVIKPTDANSSKGVFLINDEKTFDEKINISLQYSREGKAIVERYVDGTEIQVDCVAVNGVAHVLMMKDMLPMNFGNNEMQVSGYLSPGPICSQYEYEIEIIAQKIADAFGLVNTTFFYQAKCNKEGIFVLEFGARCSGGSSYFAVSLRSGMNYTKLALKSFLQEKIVLTPNCNNKIFAGVFLYMQSGTFNHFDGVERLHDEHMIDYFLPSAIPGMKASGNLESGNRAAVAISLCDDYDEARKKLQYISDEIRIVDPTGKDLMYRG